MRIALHTMVRADRSDEYQGARQEVPEELIAAIRTAGVSEWTIWRSGTDLFHLLEVEDYPAMIAAWENLPANIAWRAPMAELLEVVHGYSAQGATASSLPVVWQL
ncbi:L-rhamnose mutarotase [Streptomyces mirabilis]|uniref:L-rhamnose mutarotase n=1 Tax=Streptomyces mirabilis TaxID=68239 RepID=UPI00331FBB2A